MGSHHGSHLDTIVPDRLINGIMSGRSPFTLLKRPARVPVRAGVILKELNRDPRLFLSVPMPPFKPLNSKKPLRDSTKQATRELLRLHQALSLRLHQNIFAHVRKWLVAVIQCMHRWFIS